MFNKILWVLDNEMNPKAFERLCVDILFRNGYSNIVPVGGVHDRGRDAESRGAEGSDYAGRMTFFQFSLQKDWKQKLRSELRKVHSEDHQIDTFVFVTNQEISGRDRDRFKQETADKYGWDLIILPREWLRLQLEEANPDLTQKYLGLQLPEPRHRFEVPFEFDEPQTGDPRKAWKLFNKGDYERAAIEVKDYIKDNPKVVVAWEVLAWCQYELFRYDEALASINRALDILPGSRQALSIRGCILAERGIHQGDQESVKEANGIFKSLIPDSRGIIHYNYGNTLSALSQYAEAVVQYKIAAGHAPNDARIWKNLATAYHELGEHEKEMGCFDRAIEIDPRQPQALASKGVSLLLDFGEADEAIDLMVKALEVSDDLWIRWPNIWYWLGEACRSLKRYEEALAWVERGLRHGPGNAWLRKLKFKIIAEEWRSDTNKVPGALSFFATVLGESPLDFSARLEVMRIQAYEGREDDAWSVLQGSFSALDTTVSARLKDSGFSLEECATAMEHLPTYLAFRRSQPVDDYWDISNPEYLLSDAPPKNSRFEDSLFVYCSVAFGKARSALAQCDFDNSSTSDVVSIFSEVRRDLERAIPEAAKTFTDWILDDSTGEEATGRLAVATLYSPVVALREWGRQLGWLAVTFDLSKEVKEASIQAMVEADMDRTVTEGTLKNLLTDSLREKVREDHLRRDATRAENNTTEGISEGTSESPEGQRLEKR
jgi:tetratricopeptide (TPR) repeat protein